MQQHNIPTKAFETEAERLQAEAKTVLWVAVDGHVVGLLAVADTLKSEAQAAVAELYELGCTVTMMTGDNRVTADAIAKTARISDVMAELKPEDKAAAVKKLQTENSGLVAMVGDGINDTPCLGTSRYWHLTRHRHRYCQRDSTCNAHAQRFAWTPRCNSAESLNDAHD